MKIQAHDTRNSFDYIAWCNRVFDLVTADKDYMTNNPEVCGFSRNTWSKIFSYEGVSLPTMLLISEALNINMAYYCIKID